jgi:hypothetical protein
MIIKELAHIAKVACHLLASALGIDAILSDGLNCLARHADHFLDSAAINFWRK